MPIKASLKYLIATVVFLLPSFVSAEDAQPKAHISIIIDDLGYRFEDGMNATRLPGPLNFSILPHTPFATKLAESGFENGGEIMLHLPMESLNQNNLGPGGLTTNLTQQQFEDTVVTDLNSIPYVQGVNNHMGSLLTGQKSAMSQLMEILISMNTRYFIDSRTTSDSIAEETASEHGLATRRRDVFLDHDQSEAAINRQFDLMVKTALKNGSAIAIGHPNKTTIKVLAERLPELEKANILLVPVSELIQIERRNKEWLVSSSPSHKAVKNSKPSPSSICCAEQASQL